MAIESDVPDLAITVSPRAGAASADGQPAVLRRASEAFDELGAALQKAAGHLRERLRAVDEVEVELQLELSGEGKWVVVSLGATATVSVTLTWKNQPERARV